jgi:hypothetical protein
VPQCRSLLCLPNGQSPPVSTPTAQRARRTGRRRRTWVGQAYPRVGIAGQESSTHFASTRPCCASHTLLAHPPALLLTITGHDHHSPSSSELGICTASSFTPSGTRFQLEPTAIAPRVSPSLVTIFLHMRTLLTATVRPPSSTSSGP